MIRYPYPKSHPSGRRWSVFALAALVTSFSSVAEPGPAPAEQEAALAQLGLVPCPEKKAWLEETVAGIESSERSVFEVRDPQRLPGEPAVYYYVKVRHGERDQDSVSEEEILFPLKRRSVEPLVLIVKPSALKHGLTTRMLGAIATGRWPGQAHDLERIEIPSDLKHSNLVGIMGLAGTRLYDHISTGTLSVFQKLGDAGGMTVRMRGPWCVVAGAGKQAPLRVPDVIARLRPLL